MTRKNRFWTRKKPFRTSINSLEKSKQTHNDLTKKVVDAGNAISGLSGQLKTAAESLEHFRLDEVKDWGLDQIADLRESLTKTYNQAKVHFDDTSKQKGEAEKELATVDEQIQQSTQPTHRSWH